MPLEMVSLDALVPPRAPGVKYANAPSRHRNSSRFDMRRGPSLSSLSSAPSLSSSASPATSAASLAVEEPPSPKRRSTKRSPAPRRQECQTCGKKFQRPCQLVTHIRSHTGEQPHACPVCSRRFSVLSNCQRHVKLCQKRSKPVSDDPPETAAFIQYANDPTPPAEKPKSPSPVAKPEPDEYHAYASTSYQYPVVDYYERRASVSSVPSVPSRRSTLHDDLFDAQQVQYDPPKDDYDWSRRRTESYYQPVPYYYDQPDAYGNQQYADDPAPCAAPYAAPVPRLPLDASYVWSLAASDPRWAPQPGYST